MSKTRLFLASLAIVIGLLSSSCTLGEKEIEPPAERIIVEVDSSLNQPVLVVEDEVVFNNDSFFGRINAGQPNQIVAFVFTQGSIILSIYVPDFGGYVNIELPFKGRSLNSEIEDLMFETEAVETCVSGPCKMMRPFRNNIRITLKRSCLNSYSGFGFSDGELLLGINTLNLDEYVFGSNVVFTELCRSL